MRGSLAAGFLAAALAAGSPSGAVRAQVPVASEVRQIVTFSFVPGGAGEAQEIFRELALPLYAGDEAMLSFRGFREIESPVPLDLIVVSAFRGMAGMDDSNAALRRAGEAGGHGIGDFYAAIGPLIASHHDQFVEMIPALGSGDVSSRSRTAFVWYRVAAGENEEFERALARIVAWEQASDIPSATGRFLLADDWDYLRFVALDSLGEYQAYWAGLGEQDGGADLERLTIGRREVIVAPVPGLAVR